MTTFRTLTSLILSGALTSVTCAKEDGITKPAKLSEFRIGTPVSGEAVDAKSLAGKVVVLEFWGTHCGPCIAAMPTLVDLDKRFSAKGLQIVGMEVQGSTADQIKPLVDKLKIKFPVVMGGSSAASYPVTGIPRTFVFNAAGDLVFSGHPDEDMVKTVRKELKNVEAPPAKATTEATKATTPVTSSAPKANTTAVNAAPLIPNRAWASNEGKVMEAALLRVDGDVGKFKLANGQIFALALNKLSEPDQEYIRKNVAAK